MKTAYIVRLNEKGKGSIEYLTPAEICLICSSQLSDGLICSACNETAVK